MPTSTPHRYKNKIESDVRTMSYADLYAMYKLVLSDQANVRGDNGKALVLQKLEEIVVELNSRTYGKDPYSIDPIKVDGIEPTSIDLDRFKELEEEE